MFCLDCYEKVDTTYKEVGVWAYGYRGENKAKCCAVCESERLDSSTPTCSDCGEELTKEEYKNGEICTRCIKEVLEEPASEQSSSQSVPSRSTKAEGETMPQECTPQGYIIARYDKYEEVTDFYDRHTHSFMHNPIHRDGQYTELSDAEIVFSSLEKDTRQYDFYIFRIEAKYLH